MLYFNRNGVWFTIPIAKDAVYSRELLEKQIHTSLLGLQNLKDRSPGLDQMRFEKPGEYVIKSVFGRDDILIYPSTIQKGKKKKIEREDTGFTYVLLVELGHAPVYAAGGFAIFEPSGEGEGPNGEGLVNLKFAGWTNIVTENKDPLGIVGQTTYREGWCNSASVLPIGGVEQVKRVDQGWHAYDGDEELEERTGIYAEHNIWTYEGIDFTYHWVSVDPGPPPPAICGYTWSIYTEYGGDTSAGQFHDEQHLFYRVEVGGNQITYMWPPECNQVIERHQEWHQECGAWMYKDWLRDEIWTDGVDVGLDAASGSFMFPNTFGRVDVLYDDSVRIWGNIYGSSSFKPEDSSETAFPHTAYQPEPDWSETVGSEYARDYWSGGVYIKTTDDSFPEFFIQGCVRWPQGGNYSSQNGYRYYLREEVTSSRFYGTYYENATARQREIFLGNKSMVSEWPNPDYWTGLTYIEEYSDTRDDPDIIINCGGNEYVVKKGVYAPYFYDHGIFTKKDTGLNSDGLVDHTKVDPIYVYSVDVASGSNFSVVYGMVLDGLHYRTDEFTGNGIAAEVDIPGCENAVDSLGVLIKGDVNVRIGIKKITVKEEIEVEDNG